MKTTATMLVKDGIARLPIGAYPPAKIAAQDPDELLQPLPSHLPECEAATLQKLDLVTETHLDGLLEQRKERSSVERTA